MRITILATTAVLLLAASFARVVSANDTDDLTIQSVDASNLNGLPDSAEMIENEELDKDSSEMSTNDDDLNWLNSAEAANAVEFESDQSLPLDCCPTRRDLSFVNYTRNIRGESVTLYRSDDIQQQFLEVTCKEGVAGSPCRFMGKPISNKTVCVQRYSFSYGLVVMVNKTLNQSHYFSHEPKPLFPTGFNTEDEQYMLDHVRIRSGCSCELDRKRVKDDVLLKKTKKVTKFKHKKMMSTS